jgi:integrase/recombinase XerD
LAEDYLRYLRARNRAAPTIASYRYAIRKLAAFTDEASPRSLAAYFDFLWQTLQPSSVQHHHKALRAYFNWCVRRGCLDASPMAGMPEPQVRPPVVAPFTREQTQALYETARSLRDRALAALLLNTGIRVGEACRLHPEDVTPGRLRVNGKGGKVRRVGLSPPTERLLRALIAERGKPFTGTRTTLYWAIRRLGDRAGVPKTHPHRFRDTFACRFLENGGNIDDLQVILGHSHISMTLRYVAFGRAERAIEGQLRYAPSVA